MGCVCLKLESVFSVKRTNKRQLYGSYRMSRPVVGDSDTVARNDALPFPVVTYSDNNSCFIGFKQNEEDNQLYFCDCAKDAIKNFIQGRIDEFLRTHGEVSVGNITPLFQKEIQEKAQRRGIDDTEEVIDLFEYKKGICHKCNQVVPKYRFCHEMYGTVFKQNYGWYIKQRQYKYGFYASIKTQTPYIEEIPSEIFTIMDKELIANFESKIERLRYLQNKRREQDRAIQEQQEEEIQKYLNKDIEELTREERSGDYVHQIKKKHKNKSRLPPDEQTELEKLEELFEENWKRITDYIENEIRQKFGHHEIGSRWESETVLYNLINTKYGDEYTIKRHHRPDWLEGLEVDIFIEEAQVGIEYQGVQHYEVVEAWGGEEGLEERQDRDQRTKELCQVHGVELVEVRHDEEISEELVTKKIEPQINLDE